MKYFKAYELVDPLTYARMGENALSLFKPEILAAPDNLLLKYITRIEAGIKWIHMDGKELVLPEKRIHVFTV
jgi:hypothetical protein